MKNKINNSKLIAYFTAAGATFAIAPNAFGTIIHNTVDIDFGNGYGLKYLTLQGDTAEFKFGSYKSEDFYAVENGDSAKIYASGNKVIALSATQYVGSTTHTPAQSNHANFTSNSIGDWATLNDNKMFGMSFKIEGGGTVYGWIALQRIDYYAGKITAWSYEDDGSAINVGAIPEPVTGLALLALGAAGIAVYRRKM